eukprot:322119-Hanusia_phi.AAC.1
MGWGTKRHRYGSCEGGASNSEVLEGWSTEWTRSGVGEVRLDMWSRVGVLQGGLGCMLPRLKVVVLCTSRSVGKGQRGIFRWGRVVFCWSTKRPLFINYTPPLFKHMTSYPTPLRSYFAKPYPVVQLPTPGKNQFFAIETTRVLQPTPRIAKPLPCRAVVAPAQPPTHPNHKTEIRSQPPTPHTPMDQILLGLPHPRSIFHGTWVGPQYDC